MQRACLLFTRKNRNSSHDDRISINAIPECAEAYKVTYHTPDLRRDKEFTTSYHGVMQYLEDILFSMIHDLDPFEFIQVYTAIHPSVFYSPGDMADEDIRRLIMNMIRDGLRHDISRTE
jgi:hypothetical protein